MGVFLTCDTEFINQSSVSLNFIDKTCKIYLYSIVAFKANLNKLNGIKQSYNDNLWKLPNECGDASLMYINWQQFTKGRRGKPNEQLFPRQVVIQLHKIY